MTDLEFKRLSNFIKNKYGIDMSRKREIVDSRMENYLLTGRWDSFTDYMDAMERERAGKLEKELVDLLTINHTYFMREPDHFEYLKSTVLSYLKQREAKTRDLGIWCGATATGEEPYTLAMIMLEYFGFEHARWDTTVLATDVSMQALKKAVDGIYDKEQVEPLPENWRRRYLRRIDGGERYEMSDEVKKEIIFRKFNLMEPFPFKKKFHIVFLRNVMIYFDDKTKAELLAKVYDSMEPGGYLFIGRTETLDRTKVNFQMIRPSIFRKPETEIQK